MQIAQVVNPRGLSPGGLPTFQGPLPTFQGPLPTFQGLGEEAKPRTALMLTIVFGLIAATAVGVGLWVRRGAR